MAGVLGALDELAVLDNTYVFFTSDHGYNLGQVESLLRCVRFRVFSSFYLLSIFRKMAVALWVRLGGRSERS